MIPHQHINLKRQRGTAIIIALFVVALVAAASVAMITRLHIDIQRTSSLLNASDANLIAQGSITWSLDELKTNLKKKKPHAVVDSTPLEFKKITIDNFSVSSIIYDEQGKLNINNLSAPEYLQTFLLLLKNVEPTLPKEKAMQITAAIQDWISPTAKNPELQDYYASLIVPYRSPHKVMRSISELRLIRGMTAELYLKLSPYVTALPTLTKININSAPPAILQSLIPTLSKESAKALILFRQETAFIDPESFLAFDIIKNNPVDKLGDKITTVSDYFLIKTNVTVGEQKTLLYTLVGRNGENGKATTAILWQSKGTL